jgi:hypothetical protein
VVRPGTSRVLVGARWAGTVNVMSLEVGKSACAHQVELDLDGRLVCAKCRAVDPIVEGAEGTKLDEVGETPRTGFPPSDDQSWSNLSGFEE